MKNINHKVLRETIQKAKTEPDFLKFPLSLEGEWQMDETRPQFMGSFKIANGETVTLGSDFPPKLGGRGQSPSPLQYCFWGGMACFASIFALTASEENIEIKSLKIRTTGTIDFNQPLGLNNNAPIEGLTWEIEVDSPITQLELDRLTALAEERCPASWMMRNIVPLKAIGKKRS